MKRSSICNLKEYYVEHISKCRWYPRHVQVWRMNHPIEMHELIPSF